MAQNVSGPGRMLRVGGGRVFLTLPTVPHRGLSTRWQLTQRHLRADSGFSIDQSTTLRPDDGSL